MVTTNRTFDRNDYVYTEEQVNQYFNRLSYTGNKIPSLENLSKLLYHHLTHIPYENLDVLNNTPLSLSPENLFRKIICGKRGGYCFELQGLFYYLLKSLSYSVTQYAGRFMDEPGQVQMRRHRILVVDINNSRYVVDVGVRRESPRKPLELRTELIQDDGISRYQYCQDPFYGWVLMQQERGKEWKPIIGFTEEVQIDDDYIMPSFYCEKHPDSTFNKFMKVSIFTESSNLTLVGNTYKVYQNAEVVKQQELQTNDEARRMLLETFGIELPDSYQILLYHQREDL